MYASVNVLISSQPPEMVIDHKGEKLSFSISVFGRKAFQEGFDVFQYINQYWESLPENRQDTIFSIYKQIDYGFTNIHNNEDLFQFLSLEVSKLIEEHNLDQIQDWIAFKSDIRIPPDIKADFVANIDENTSREKTYTRSDYAKLTALALLFRCMVPIWGQYIRQSRQETGTEFKEYYAFQLTRSSAIAGCVPMTKLRVYIEHIVGDDKNDANNILKGISSEDFGYWLLALVCIRRLCVGDIRGHNPDIHLITLIYKFIIQKIRNTDNDFENIVKQKNFDDRAPEGDNKISTLERYKIKANISLGDIVQLEYSVMDVRSVAMRLCYQMDPALLERSLLSSQELQKHQIQTPQITLLRWVMKPVISPKGLLYLSKPSIVSLIGVMEAVLWTRGHKYLALLSSSHPVVSEREMVISPMDSKMRVPKELVEELDRLYRFKRTDNRRKETDGKEVNLAMESIEAFTKNATMYAWKPTADGSMLEEVFGSSSRKFPIRPDIKLDLTRLVIEIGNRTWI